MRILADAPPRPRPLPLPLPLRQARGVRHGGGSIDGQREAPECTCSVLPYVAAAAHVAAHDAVSLSHPHPHSLAHPLALLVNGEPRGGGGLER